MEEGSEDDEDRDRNLCLEVLVRNHFELSLRVAGDTLKPMQGADSRFYFPALVLFLIFAGAGLVRGEPQEPMASVWRVSSDTSTVFLAGSVHLLRESDYPLPVVYDEAYERSEKLLFEVDLGGPKDPAAAQRIANVGKLPPGETISEHVSEGTYSLLQAYLKEREIDGRAFDSMRPGMAAIAIAAFEHMRKGAMPHLGVDMVYYKRALEDRKPVAGLETTEFQLTLFSELSSEKQEIMLSETLENMEGSEKRSDELVKAWRQGKVEVLKRLLADQIAEDEEIGEVLLFRRNRAWLPEVLKLLKGDKNTMVVVGAGHLVGKGSIVDLLEKRGYLVKQMRIIPTEDSESKKTPEQQVP